MTSARALYRLNDHARVLPDRVQMDASQDQSIGHDNDREQLAAEIDTREAPGPSGVTRKFMVARAKPGGNGA